MTTPATTPPPASPPTERADSYVAWSIALLLGALAVAGWARGSSLFDGITTREAIGVLLIGVGVGAAELASRYRDDPVRACFSLPGFVFMALNGALALLGLILIVATPDLDPGDRVKRLLIAGFGAMAVVRTKVATIRQPGGTDVSVGPAFLIDTLLGAVNREVDRGQADERQRIVVKWSKSLAGWDFSLAQPFLLTSLAAFQSMLPEDRHRITELLRQLEADDQMRALPDQAKYTLIGFDLLNIYGPKTFDATMEQLHAYLTGLTREATERTALAMREARSLADVEFASAAAFLALAIDALPTLDADGKERLKAQLVELAQGGIAAATTHEARFGFAGLAIAALAGNETCASIFAGLRRHLGR